MTLFSRKKQPATQLQIPDELAQRASVAYGNQQFARAFELYSTAIDKLHTMYVVGQSAHRRPGAHDDTVLAGASSALGAALAMDANAPVGADAERSIAYLQQIAAAAGPESERYNAALVDLDRAWRLGRR